MNKCQCLDYAVSWTFWRAHCIEVHGFDPGDNEYRGKETSSPERPKHVVHHYLPISPLKKRETYTIR